MFVRSWQYNGSGFESQNHDFDREVLLVLINSSTVSITSTASTFSTASTASTSNACSILAPLGIEARTFSALIVGYYGKLRCLSASN